jgi:hypothetical protein
VEGRIPKSERKVKPKNSLLWIFEALEDDPRFLLTRFFNMHAAYLDGKLYLAVADGKEPWNGLMICVARKHHAAILSDYPQLVSHKVLGKWLYLSRSHPEFEGIATELAMLARGRDPRLGVEPQSRKSRSRRDSKEQIKANGRREVG